MKDSDTSDLYRKILSEKLTETADTWTNINIRQKKDFVKEEIVKGFLIAMSSAFLGMFVTGLSGILYGAAAGASGWAMKYYIQSCPSGNIFTETP